MTEQTETILCQSCIERQLDPINPAVGLYAEVPICEVCLGFILSNKENVQADSIAVPVDTSSLEGRKSQALELLDKFEEVFDNFPMSAEEVLSERDIFYNHRSPALVNCTTEQIKQIINRRKAVLFAIRIKDEQWSTIIEQLRQEERVAKGLTGVAKSIREKAKQPSGTSDTQKKKLAKMMGISVAQLEAMGADARTTEFAGIIGQENSNKAIEQKTPEANSARQALTNIQDKLSGNIKPKINPVTGKPY